MESPSDRLRLVLCEPGDPVATWVAAGLVSRGLRAEVVTSVELCGGSRWDHRVGSGGASFAVRLADGRRFESSTVAGVVNRLVGVPYAVLAGFDDADRVYVEQEWRALVCSVLAGLGASGVPVLDPPHPYALGGRVRSPAEWIVLAAGAGFAVPEWRWTSAIPEVGTDAGGDTTAVVVGGRVIGDVDGPAGVACRRLAELAGVRLLAIGVGSDDAGARPRFAGASTMPDFRLAGEVGLDALAELLA